MGDMNAKAGKGQQGNIASNWGVEGSNENREQLIGMCEARRLYLATTWYEHKIVHIYTWKRAEDVERVKRSQTDYVVIDEGMRKWVRYS